MTNKKPSLYDLEQRTYTTHLGDTSFQVLEPLHQFAPRSICHIDEFDISKCPSSCNVVVHFDSLVAFFQVLDLDMLPRFKMWLEDECIRHKFGAKMCDCCNQLIALSAAPWSENYLDDIGLRIVVLT